MFRLTVVCRDRTDYLVRWAEKVRLDARGGSVTVAIDNKEECQDLPIDLQKSKRLLSPNPSRVAEDSKSEILTRRPSVMMILRYYFIKI